MKQRCQASWLRGSVVIQNLTSSCAGCPVLLAVSSAGCLADRGCVGAQLHSSEAYQRDNFLYPEFPLSEGFF